MHQFVQNLTQNNPEVCIDGNIYSYKISSADLIEICKELYFEQQFQLKTLTALDLGNGNFRVLYVFGIPKENIFIMPYIELKNSLEFPSIANEIHEAANYERKIKTFFGLIPIGNMDQKPILLHENWPTDLFPLRKDFPYNLRPKKEKGEYKFAEIQGEGIYEIPVGPVHAGIIEPGHFRFSVAGEEIVNLEAKLGYVHKGTEKLFESLSLEDKLKLSEKVSGDSAFSHSLAFCQAIEQLAQIKVPEKAKWLRVVFGELERLANHFGDLGFIMLDTGFSFGGSNGTRLREMIMQWNEKLSGSRFLRGVNQIGGVTQAISPENILTLQSDLNKIFKDFLEIIEVADNIDSLQNRLENTGKLDPEIAKDHGVVGVAGRAVGRALDTRRDYPYAAYDRLNFEIATETLGDVNARFKVRVKEVKTSIQILTEALKQVEFEGEILSTEKYELAKSSYGLGLVEGWRGEIVYLIVTDRSGQITRVDVRDPSFLNWTVLGYAGKGNIVPDFPLINKSFNLSYSGNDL